MTLAIDGGKPEVKGEIARFNTIGPDEIRAVRHSMQCNALSGYLAGKERGGPAVQMLEHKWAKRFKVKHAIACNSATSGLLAAAFAVGLKRGDTFLSPSLTMSATAAAPMFTGAIPIFCDVSPHTFSMNPKAMVCDDSTKAVMLTHLFGLSINESWWTGMAHERNWSVIVDAAQAPFATCDGVLAGTTADIGVFSWNVHKPLQAGEGGICVTNDDELAHKLRMFVNHGECAGERQIGLNLRMCELTAAIALSQLSRAEEIIDGRVALAEALTEAVRGLPGLHPPYVHPDCRHVYYCWALKIDGDRDWFVRAINAEGVPLQAGYGPPLHRLPAFEKYGYPLPITERLHDKELALFENCAWDPTPEQIGQIGAAFRKVAEKIACE